MGLGLVDAPYSIENFLGGAGTESPGWSGYPATKAQLLAAARQELVDVEEPNLADIDWLAERLPEGTYRDAGEVMAALMPPIQGPELDGLRWLHRLRLEAIPNGTRLQVPSNGWALLVEPGGAPLDLFSPGEYVLTRDTAPIAAARSRPPAPGFARSVLRSWVVFFSTRDQEGRLSLSSRTRSGEPFYVKATVRYALEDPRKFVGSSTGKSFSEPPPADALLSNVVAPALGRWIQTQEGGPLSADRETIEAAVRTALEAGGFSVRSVKVEYAGSSPVGPAFAGAAGDPLARLPPEMRSMMQTQMEAAMRRRSAGGKPVPPGPSPMPPVAPSAPGRPPEQVACPACRTPNPASGRFCQNCGGPLSSTRICPACGREVAPAVKFCGSCGATLPR